MKEGEEYSLTIIATVTDELFENADLLQALYNEIRLVDAQGNLYPASGGLTSDMKTNFYYLFALPNAVKKEEVSLTFEEVKENKLELALENNHNITLWPIDSKIFQELGDDVFISTRLGDTVHHSGAIFKAGSGMRMETMRNTQQFDSPMVAFAYDDFGESEDEMLDSLEKVAEKTILRVNGKEVNPEALWLIEGKGCFIFSLMDLSPFDTLPIFEQENNYLIITLP